MDSHQHHSWLRKYPPQERLVLLFNDFEKNLIGELSDMLSHRSSIPVPVGGAQLVYLNGRAMRELPFNVSALAAAMWNSQHRSSRVRPRPDCRFIDYSAHTEVLFHDHERNFARWIRKRYGKQAPSLVRQPFGFELDYMQDFMRSFQLRLIDYWEVDVPRD